LEKEWSMPLAVSLERTKFLDTREIAELLDRPEVAARLAEMNTEFRMAQEQVRELLQTPDWSR
jgi:hypothetical protein